MAGSAHAIYQTKCASCHGKYGEVKALGHSGIIRGMPEEMFIAMTKEYASGDKQATPIAKIVKRQFLKNFDDEEIKAVAKYVNELQNVKLCFNTQ